MATFTRVVSGSFEILPQTQARSKPKAQSLDSPFEMPVTCPFPPCLLLPPSSGPLPLSLLGDLRIPRAVGSALPLPVPLRPGDLLTPPSQPFLPGYSRSPYRVPQAPPSCPVCVLDACSPHRLCRPPDCSPATQRATLCLRHARQVLLRADRDRVSHTRYAGRYPIKICN